MARPLVTRSGELLSRLEDLRLDRGWTRATLCDDIRRLVGFRVDPSGISRALARGGCSALLARAIEKYLAAQEAPRKRRKTSRTARPYGASV